MVTDDIGADAPQVDKEVDPTPTEEIVSDDEVSEPPASGDSGTPEDVEPESEPSSEDNEDVDGSKKLPSGVKDAIHYRKRAQEAERQLAELRASQTPPTPIPPSGPPKQEDFKTWEEWNIAHSRYIAKEEATQLYQVQKREDLFRSRLDKAAEKNPEVLEIVNDPGFTTTPLMTEAIKTSDIPGTLILYFRDHPTERLRIANMTPFDQVRTMGKLEATLKDKATQSPTPTKKVSQAPEPPKKVSGRSTPDTGYSNLSTEDYIQKRNAEEAASRRR